MVGLKEESYAARSNIRANKLVEKGRYAARELHKRWGQELCEFPSRSYATRNYK